MDVLGEPLDAHGVWFSFEGLTIMSSAPKGFEGYESAVALQVTIWSWGLSKLEINDILLDNVETRADVVALLGIPDDSSMTELRYRIIYPPREYSLFFEYVYYEGEEYINTVRFFYFSQ